MPLRGRGTRAQRRRRRFVLHLALPLLAVLATVLGVTAGVHMEASASTTTDPFTSSWDVPLSGNAVLPNSATEVANLVTQYKSAYGTVGINGGNFDGYPIVTVPSTQALVPIAVKSGCNNFTPNTGTSVPIPSTAVPGTSSDHPLIVWQPSTSTEWEFWEAADSGGWSACWGGKLTGLSTSTGVFPNPYGLAASGISYLGTMITESDIESGAIDHVIAIQVAKCNGDVAPADRTDCGSASGQVSEGTFLDLPSTLAMPSGLTPFAQMVFTALQDYGAVVTDQSGGVNLVAETNADWTAAGNTGTDPITASWDGKAAYAALNGMPWGSLQVIAPTPDATTPPPTTTTSTSTTTTTTVSPPTTTTTSTTSTTTVPPPCDPTNLQSAVNGNQVTITFDC